MDRELVGRYLEALLGSDDTWAGQIAELGPSIHPAGVLLALIFPSLSGALVCLHLAER